LKGSGMGKKQKQDDSSELRSHKSSGDELFWGDDLRKELVKEAISSLNNAYFQIINLCIVLLGIYLAGIPYLKDALPPSRQIGHRLLALLPHFLLALSLMTLFIGMSNISFDAEANRPLHLKETTQKLVRRKSLMLRVALFLVFGSILCALIDLWLFL
jgi:energy-coupling factor transporter transmembrane protein EcfT